MVPVRTPYRLDLTAVVMRRLSTNVVDVFDLMVDVLDAGARRRHQHDGMMHGADAEEGCLPQPVGDARVDAQNHRPTPGKPAPYPAARQE